MKEVKAISTASLHVTTLFIIYKITSYPGTVIKVLCYKSEGRWFDPSWYQWIFH